MINRFKRGLALESTNLEMDKQGYFFHSHSKAHDDISEIIEEALRKKIATLGWNSMTYEVWSCTIEPPSYAQ